MALLVCDVEKGARDAEATVILKDYQGRPEFLPLDRGLITQEEGKNWIGVYVLHIDPKTKTAFVNLPEEADSGTHRIWVKLKQLRHIDEKMS
jgi:hypothetical protein